MFGIDSGELFIIAIVALLVIGPKDLPRVMRAIGNFVGKARGMAGHFRAGVDNMIRESELQDMEKLWKANNERIMRAAPPPADSDWGKGEEPAEPATPVLPSPAAADPSRPKPPPARPRRPRGKAASGPVAPTAPPADDAA
ncbi:Sec-independent protein translocase protein TatB [Sphingosinicella sp.]|uniref:Sec-independent protein translocase protein TatB n=1 Tax=Sphingosinicella sp. TaxID=1917971 RepID=UPI004037D301